VEALRYNKRTTVERINSHLHEEHGGRHSLAAEWMSRSFHDHFTVKTVPKISRRASF
jgi:hypothetical protein